MRDNRITLLKIENDSNAPEDLSLAPMVLSETTEGQMWNQTSARAMARGAGTQPIRSRYGGHYLKPLSSVSIAARE